MQQLDGESQLEPSIMTQLFLQRLPTNAQLILASSKDILDTESLAKLADKILEVAPTHSTPPTLSLVAPPSAPQPDPSTELRELRELVSQLAFLTPANRCMSAMFGVLRSARSEMENTTKVVFLKANYSVGVEVLSG